MGRFLPCCDWPWLPLQADSSRSHLPEPLRLGQGLSLWVVVSARLPGSKANPATYKWGELSQANGRLCATISSSLK